jgi:hypothetical protein
MNGVLGKAHATLSAKRPEAELTQGQKDYFKTYKAFGKEALIQQKKAFEYAILEVDYLLLRLNYDKVDIDNDAKFVSFLVESRQSRKKACYELPDTQPADDIPDAN